MVNSMVVSIIDCLENIVEYEAFGFCENIQFYTIENIRKYMVNSLVNTIIYCLENM